MNLFPALADTPANPAPLTVLVVDDEPNNCEMLAFLLDAQGYRVVTAADGDEALEVVAASRPDAILLDIVMPGLDGLEVCQRLKSDPRTVFIPVVLITGLNTPRDRIRGAAAGADDFVTKPFDTVELTTRLRSLLRIKTLHDQVEQQNRELEQRVADRTAELQQALTDLQELDRLKSQFIANVSHELRTPLMHVKGCVQLVADGTLGELTSAQSESMDVAQSAIRQLERIVADVLDFGDSSRRPLGLETLDLPSICQAALNEVTASAALQRIAISLSLPPDLPRVLANRPALTRIVRHLLDNAVKFSPPERPVVLAAEWRPPQVRLSVQDSGYGIAQPQLGHIFDPFYQVDGATTRRANGLGIGLSVVRRLAEMQDAQVGVESQPGQGSCFYIDLQAAPQPDS